MRAKCSVCKQEKPKIKTDRKFGHCYVYVDGDGKTWRGTKCRDCLTESNKGTLDVVYTKNMCRKCNEFLPISRRFHCEGCVKTHDYEYEELVYF